MKELFNLAINFNKLWLWLEAGFSGEKYRTVDKMV